MSNVEWHGTWKLLESRMEACQAEMARQMNISLYGDREPQRVMTVWEKVSTYIAIRRERMHDAWLVLTGQADIGY